MLSLLGKIICDSLNDLLIRQRLPDGRYLVVQIVIEPQSIFLLYFDDFTFICAQWPQLHASLLSLEITHIIL